MHRLESYFKVAKKYKRYGDGLHNILISRIVVSNSIATLHTAPSDIKGVCLLGGKLPTGVQKELIPSIAPVPHPCAENAVDKSAPAQSTTWSILRTQNSANYRESEVHTWARVCSEVLHKHASTPLFNVLGLVWGWLATRTCPMTLVQSRIDPYAALWHDQWRWHSSALCASIALQQIYDCVCYPKS